MRSLIVAIVLLLTSAGAARAATLTTAPFPGEFVLTGLAVCEVTNIGTTAGLVKLELVDVGGVVVNTLGPTTLGPGLTQSGAIASFATHTAIFCRITVPSAKHFRGSFSYITPSQVTTVIPAQ